MEKLTKIKILIQKKFRIPLKKYIFPEYLNPNEKLSFEIRKKLLENNVEINRNTIQEILKSNNRFGFYLPNIYMQNMRAKIDNFSESKDRLLVKSLGIDYQQNVPSYILLVN
jgi:hypothetical protein